MVAAAAEIDVPGGWECRRPPDPHALLAHPPDQRGPVRPTLVVDLTAVPGARSASDPCDGTAVPGARSASDSFDAYAATQLAGLLATYGGHLIHADLTRRPAPTLDVALAVEQLGVDLTVVQRHVLPGDGHAVVATGTCADADWPAIAPDLLAAVRSLRPARAAGPSP